MKGINKKKIEFLQPLQECRPMNQQNKFSPEITWYKHDISAGSFRTGRTAVALVKFRVLRTIKGAAYTIKKVSGKQVFIAGATWWKHTGSHSWPPLSMTLTPEIYSLIREAIKMEFWSTSVSQHLSTLTAHRLDLQELCAALHFILRC